MVSRWSLPNYVHSFLWNYPQITSEPTDMIPVSFYDNILLFSSKQFLHNWQFLWYISRPSNAFYLTSADCTIFSNFKRVFAALFLIGHIHQNVSNSNDISTKMNDFWLISLWICGFEMMWYTFFNINCLIYLWYLILEQNSTTV